MRGISVGLSQPQGFQTDLLESEMVTQLVHNRDPHLARDRLWRRIRSFQRAAEDRDPVWRDEVVIRSTLRQRHALIEPEQRLRIVIRGTLAWFGMALPQRQLLRRRFVFDDDLDVIEHSDDFGSKAVQSTNHDALEPLSPRLLDTTSDPVTHEVNSTSFGLFSPVLRAPLCVRTCRERTLRSHLSWVRMWP